jgi:hypothetical protein
VDDAAALDRWTAEQIIKLKVVGWFRDGWNGLAPLATAASSPTPPADMRDVINTGSSSANASVPAVGRRWRRS